MALARLPAVELGAFMVTASLACECLDLTSVRLPPKILMLFCPGRVGEYCQQVPKYVLEFACSQLCREMG